MRPKQPPHNPQHKDTSYKFRSGKYAGLKISEVIKIDPSYIRSCIKYAANFQQRDFEPLSWDSIIKSLREAKPISKPNQLK